MAFGLSVSGPITMREAKKQRAQLTRSLASDLRKKDRELLRTLRQAIKDAKRRRKERIAEVRELCRESRKGARERGLERLEALRRRQKQERDDLRALTRREKGAAKALCASKATVRAEADAEVESATKAYRDERESQHEARTHTRIWTGRGAKLSAKDRAAARKQALEESDDEVRSDIPPELLPVWEKVKRGIHATPRMSRSEAFLQWVHDNSADVMHIIDEELAKDLKRLEREELEHHRAMKKRNRYTRSPAHLASDLEEIPF